MGRANLLGYLSEMGRVTPLAVCGRLPLLLAEAIIAEAEVVNEVLHDSYCMSGQQVNIGKSQVIFGEGVSPRQFDLSKEYS